MTRHCRDNGYTPVRTRVTGVLLLRGSETLHYKEGIGGGLG